MAKKPDEKQDEVSEPEKTENLTRRAFLKVMMGFSVVLSAIPFAPMVRFFIAKAKVFDITRKKIANKNDLSEGSTMIFFYPGEEDFHRSFLTHLSHEDLIEAEANGTGEFIVDGFVAYNTVCTHLQCPIALPDDDVFICPCHGALFSIVDGTVLGGPAPRPVPIIRLEIDDATGDIYATEIIGKIGYGRE